MMTALDRSRPASAGIGQQVSIDDAVWTGSRSTFAEFSELIDGRRAAGLNRLRYPARARLSAMGLPFEGQTSALTAAKKGFPWPITIQLTSTPPSSIPVASSTWTSSRHRGRRRHRAGFAAGQDRLHHLRRRLRQHRLDQERHHLHRRRRGHPALPRLPDRAAGREVDVHRGQLPADLRRTADQGAAGQVHHPAPAAHDAARGHEAVLRRLPAQRAPDGGAVQRGQRTERLLPGLAGPVRRRSRSSCPRSGCWPSCRRSRPTPTRSRSASRSCTRTTR